MKPDELDSTASPLVSVAPRLGGDSVPSVPSARKPAVAKSVPSVPSARNPAVAKGGDEPAKRPVSPQAAQETNENGTRVMS